MAHDVFVVDDHHPEDLAMLQALYSRSPASVVTHIEKLKLSGSGKFMDQYYVGYGHSSIGDCGATTCFIEQVSMLVAKAVQDNPLYNGQEASTRYLDFSRQAVVDPYKHKASTAIQNRWMEIYNYAKPLLMAGLEKKHPFDPAIYKNEKVWQNTLLARSFDISRSLLPIGTTTLLSWSTSLRQARDNLRRLKYHPLPEIREVAQNIFAKLLEKYPNSFKGDEMLMDAETPRDSYLKQFSTDNHFVSADDLIRRFNISDADMKQLMEGEIVARRDALDLEGLRKFEKETLASRPAQTPLPWRLESYGRYNFLFMLDFGSFRDIQRHRNAVCQIPLIDGRFGMHPWYVSQFTDLMGSEDSKKLLGDIAEQFNRIAELGKKGVSVSVPFSQYLYPMGTMGLTHVSYSIPETVYVGELRSGKTVHPSLRPIAQKMLKILSADLSEMAVHGDMDVDSWTAKRGEQTIAAK